MGVYAIILIESTSMYLRSSHMDYHSKRWQPRNTDESPSTVTADSGKSRLAHIIGARLNLSVIELDALYHVNNWHDTPLDEFRAKIERITKSSPNGWVSAGNYFRVKDLLMDQADVVVWLRLPFHIVYWRLLWRTIRDLFTKKPIDMGRQRFD